MPLGSLLAMDAENTIRRFFDAMNTGDADAVAALVDPSIVMRMGPQIAKEWKPSGRSRASRGRTP